HFTVNTFTDKEWGYGDESPDVFNPIAFDADQIVESAAAGGLKGLILTCKHHDGFCLWPTRATPHSVAHSAWRHGKGDAVRDISAACARHGLKFGTYLSPWDRNNPAYGTPAYLSVYRAQLRELLTGYGPLFEVWFDGANGGDGYYGGAREKRDIDNRVYYDWPTTWAMVRELQPDACMFSDAGPDVRWVGNEEGFAADPCWSTINKSDFAPGRADSAVLHHGLRNGADWLPAECDVSVRPGWFYHAAEDDRVRTPDNLMDLYFKSVGRGGSLLLNLPPDRRGLIHEQDRASLATFKQRLDRLFAHDLARSGVSVTGPTRGNDPAYGPARLIDGSAGTFWCTDDNVLTPETVLQFREPVQFSIVSLREYLPLGQRVDAFAIDAWKDGAWREIAAAQAIGHRRLLAFPTVTTDRVRLRITAAQACPAISEFSLYQGVP
ncbi:MAG: alpha-L-fucosidase, partial [Kiritimatiellia bacterium]